MTISRISFVTFKTPHPTTTAHAGKPAACIHTTNGSTAPVGMAGSIANATPKQEKAEKIEKPSFKKETKVQKNVETKDIKVVKK